MKPVKHAGCNFVYYGPSPDIGDLHVRIMEDGSVSVVYDLDEDDRKAIAEGGRVELRIYQRPMPPISMITIPEGMCRPVDEHPWKAIPELDDPERNS